MQLLADASVVVPVDFFRLPLIAVVGALFYAEPFERGFGTTLGTGLRRVLISSLQGAAIVYVTPSLQDRLAPIRGWLNGPVDPDDYYAYPEEPAPDPLATGRYLVEVTTPHLSGPDACHAIGQFVVR